MAGRKFDAGSLYRYGFNGKENDNEVKGEGNQQDYGMRIYDPRIAKFLSPDPEGDDYPWNTLYAFAESDPINFIDVDGLHRGGGRSAGRSGGRTAASGGRGPRTPGGQTGQDLGLIMRRNQQLRDREAAIRHNQRLRTDPAYRESARVLQIMNNVQAKETYWQSVLSAARISFVGGNTSSKSNFENGKDWDDLVFKALSASPKSLGVARQVSLTVSGIVNGEPLVARIRVDNVAAVEVNGKIKLDLKEAKFSIYEITIKNVTQTLTPQQQTAANILINGTRIDIKIRGKGSAEKLSIITGDKFENETSIGGLINQINIVVPAKPQTPASVPKPSSR